MLAFRFNPSLIIPSVLFRNTYAAPDPAITVSGDSTGVIFLNCGFHKVESGICVIQVTTLTDTYVYAQFPSCIRYEYMDLGTRLLTTCRKEAFLPFFHHTLLVLTHGHKKVSTAEAVYVGYMLLGLGDWSVCHAWLRWRTK